MTSRRGTSLIDLLIAMAIIALLFGGVYLVYYSVEAAIANVGIRSAATAVISNEIEMIRNLPYADVGTVGGIPAGVIPQTQTVTYGNFSFVIQTTVLNIDDPFDTSPSSTPVADYKLVDIQATCPFCENFAPLEITTTVASRNLTAGTPYGSIFVNIINADGIGVPEATVQVVNASVTPSVDVIDTTDASGVLELIGVPTSTQGYQVFASKAGFSSAQTYPVGGAGNPNPVQPNITVASETVSGVTLAIDAVSTVNVSTTNDTCQPIANIPIAIQGTELIGTDPDVYNFATTSVTGASGALTFANVPWDTYSLELATTSEDIAGMVPGDGPLTVNPGSTQNFQFILQPAHDPSLLVTVDDASTSLGISNANVSLTANGFSQSLETDHAMFSQSDWSEGQYASQNGEINTSQSGELVLLANASSTYATSTPGLGGSLISDTFDSGSESSTFNAISWNPTNQPTSTGAGSLEFQVAGNNDNATWNFIGPDGTANTYFTSPGQLPSSLADDRYFRYEAFLSTQDPTTSPTLNNVSIDFTASCVPSSQVLFTGLAHGNYTLDVTAQNYAENSTTVSIGSGAQSSTVSLMEL
jgi:hypothetical protein